jgi:SAM-dependent methyltransferase
MSVIRRKPNPIKDYTFEEYRELYEGKPKYRDELAAGGRSSMLLRESTEWKIPSLESVAPSREFSSIAEVGCFTGDVIGNIFAEVNVSRIGFDVQRDAIGEAARRYPQCTFLAEDFFHSSERFDVIILSDIVEHIEDDAGLLRTALTRAQVVLMNLPLEKKWSTIFRKYGPDDSSGHLRSYSRKSALSLLADSSANILGMRERWYYETDLGKESMAIGSPLAVARRRALAAIPWIRRRFFASNLFVAMSLKASAAS